MELRKRELKLALEEGDRRELREFLGSPGAFSRDFMGIQQRLEGEKSPNSSRNSSSGKAGSRICCLSSAEGGDGADFSLFQSKSGIKPWMGPGTLRAGLFPVLIPKFPVLYPLPNPAGTSLPHFPFPDVSQPFPVLISLPKIAGIKIKMDFSSKGGRGDFKSLDIKISRSAFPKYLGIFFPLKKKPWNLISQRKRKLKFVGFRE